MNITIPWNILRALLKATSKDKLRFVLQGIQVEPKSEKEVVLVATNGRILCAAKKKPSQFHRGLILQNE